MQTINSQCPPGGRRVRLDEGQGEHVQRFGTCPLLRAGGLQPPSVAVHRSRSEYLNYRPRPLNIQHRAL